MGMKKEQKPGVETDDAPYKVKGLISKGGRLYYRIVVNGETLRGSFDLKDNYRNRIFAEDRLTDLKRAARSGEYKPPSSPPASKGQSNDTNRTCRRPAERKSESRQ